MGIKFPLKFLELQKLAGRENTSDQNSSSFLRRTVPPSSFVGVRVTPEILRGENSLNKKKFMPSSGKPASSVSPPARISDLDSLCPPPTDSNIHSTATTATRPAEGQASGRAHPWIFLLESHDGSVRYMYMCVCLCV